MSFVDRYANVDDREFEYLVEFVFQLTVYGREVLSHEPSELQRAALKQLNEINHRVLNRIKDLGSRQPWSEKAYLLDMVPHHVRLSPVIEKGVAAAAVAAFGKYNA